MCPWYDAAAVMRYGLASTSFGMTSKFDVLLAAILLGGELRLRGIRCPAIGQLQGHAAGCGTFNIAANLAREL